MQPQLLRNRMKNSPSFPSELLRQSIVQKSPTLEINEQVNRLWQEGSQVFHFGFGESRFPVHPKLAQALAQNSDKKSYLPTLGLPALRQAIARYQSQALNVNFSPQQTIITPGSKAALFGLQMALKADLILPTPSWVSYAPQAQLVGSQVWHVPASAAETPAADLSAFSLDALEYTVGLSENPVKMLLINSPNNPIGVMFSADFLQSVAHFCRRHKILVVSDEIYSRVNHPGETHHSIAAFYPEGTIVTGGLSKHLSLGGWRLGYGLFPAALDQVVQTIAGIASEIWSCAAAPIQHAALPAFSGDPEIEAYIDQCAALHAARVHFIYDALVELGATCPQPQGGFYLFPNFDRWRAPLQKVGVQNSTQLARYLLDAYQIATLPGTAFGVPSETLSLRLSASYVGLETDEKAAHELTIWQNRASDADYIQNNSDLAAAVEGFKRFWDDLVSIS